MSCRRRSSTSCGPILAEVADEMIAGRGHGAGLRASARGSVRRGDPRGGAGGAAPLPGRDRGPGPGGAARRLLGARAAGRCGPGAASSRCSAPTGSGARVAWRRFAAAGVEAGLEPDVLYLLAESIFAYIDVLSAESAEGHALEQSAAASEAELRRRRLVRLLVREPPPDPAAVEAAAAERAGRCRARWPCWRSRARAAPRPSPGSRAGTISEVDRRADLRAGRGPGRPRAARRRSSGLSSWPGPGRARHDRRLDRGPDQLRPRPGGARAGAIRRSQRWSWRRERTGELLLRSDPGLAGELAAERLAPLDGPRPRARASG